MVTFCLCCACCFVSHHICNQQFGRRSNTMMMMMMVDTTCWTRFYLSLFLFFWLSCSFFFLLGEILPLLYIHLAFGLTFSKKIGHRLFDSSFLHHQHHNNFFQMNTVFSVYTCRCEFYFSTFKKMMFWK